MNTVTIELDDRTSSALLDAAERSGRPVISLLDDAIQAWLDVENGHLEDIRAGLEEADREAFVTADRIRGIVAGIDAGQ